MESALQRVIEGALGRRIVARDTAPRRRRRRVVRGRPRRRPAGLRQDPPRRATRVLHDRGDRSRVVARRAARCRCPRCWPFPTTRRITSCSSGSTKAGRRARRNATSERRSRRCTAPARPLRPGRPSHHRESRTPERAVRARGRSSTRATGSYRWPAWPATRMRSPRPTIAALEQLAGRLDQLGVPEEPPARLHGDLWAGNRLVDTDGRSWLIDPAAHGGHREFDLAMMRLFGGFGDECFAVVRRGVPARRRLARAGRAPPDRAPRRARDQVRRWLRRRRDEGDHAVLTRIPKRPPMDKSTGGRASRIRAGLTSSRWCCRSSGRRGRCRRAA